MRTIVMTRIVPLVVLAVAVLAGPAAAQEFDWRGRLAAGRTLEIKGVNGAIEAVAAAGDEIRVTASKRARRSDPDDVRIEVVEHADGVTICAVYPPGRDGRENECAEGRGGRMNSERNDVSVEFRVEVPRGIRFAGRTVNGHVYARGIGGDVEAHTVNGEINVSSSGLVHASTVNGSMEIEMGRADWGEDLDFETVNGSITVTLTGDVNADVSASTVNGSISTDYPLTIQGRFGPKRLNGKIGSGGRALSMATVNGSIELRRR
jgi:hypothetical protein